MTIKEERQNAVLALRTIDFNSEMIKEEKEGNPTKLIEFLKNLVQSCKKHWVIGHHVATFLEELKVILDGRSKGLDAYYHKMVNINGFVGDKF